MRRSRAIEVWVAAGTYVECITLKAEVALYGGFAGGETDLSQRNWTVKDDGPGRQPGRQRGDGSRPGVPTDTGSMGSRSATAAERYPRLATGRRRESTARLASPTIANNTDHGQQRPHRWRRRRDLLLLSHPRRSRTTRSRATVPPPAAGSTATSHPRPLRAAPISGNPREWQRWRIECTRLPRRSRATRSRATVPRAAGFVPSAACRSIERQHHLRQRRRQ